MNYIIKMGTRAGHQQQRFSVWAVVNPNAHNVRYGRDCRAPAVITGVVIARNLKQAWKIADAHYGYRPDQRQYEYLLTDVTP